jgi:uncharacterized Fe-S cluster-containing MiaB family protein
MDIEFFLPKRSVINLYMNHNYCLHSPETEVVIMLIFKWCRDKESGVQILCSYVYNTGCSFMVSLNTITSWDILCDWDIL